MLFRTTGCIVATICSLGFALSAGAQQAKTAASKPHDHAAHTHSAESLAFVLPKWKTLHFDDATKASQHAEMIKKLGCELKQDSHAGHTDLSYRCVDWRTLEVNSHELADQWSGWLKSSGFDVSHAHAHADFAKGSEVVEFRLVTWKTIHGKNAADDKQLIELLSKIGCEVTASEHTGHSDIRFRAPTWRDIHVADHAKAEQMTAWLKQYGFEVAPHKH